jgi:hypothetical protein
MKNDLTTLSSETREYMKDALTAAKDLNYGDNVIFRLEAAKSVGAIEHIMASARKGEIPNGNIKENNCRRF